MSNDVQDQSSLVDDPLLAALPPKTDYITYLTILEYQLTPENLPTLTRLLQEDDGTLASEIGWDLLRLVLPILRVEPEHARKCLDTIARRGNPRELVVRVAEEFERLGQNDDRDFEADPAESADGLPTFAGEAPHVHLGDMTLKGMPPEKARVEASDEADSHHGQIENDELRLQALLSMLSLLHPRIRTKHPSRFLATSLPAALAAYRRLSMSTMSTKVFIKSLVDLAGRKRPALPPRISTSDVLSSAPLPDPEAKNATVVAPAAEDAAISHRLLQAVLLEVMEEYIAASAEAQPPVTARLRAFLQPESITTARKAELSTLTTSMDAHDKDETRRAFVSVAKDLRVDVIAELRYLLSPNTTGNSQEEPEYDYPTKPSQIPFPSTGLLILLSAQLYQQALDDKSRSTDSAFVMNDVMSAVLRTIDRQYESDTRLRNSPPAIDSLLSLLYLHFCSPAGPPLSDRDTLVESQTFLVAIFFILQDIFISLPDQDLRDNAYHIASHILHGHCCRETRMKILKMLLQLNSGSALSPIHEAQSGNLKAIAIDWLKAELYPTPGVLDMMSQLPDNERGLQIAHLHELSNLIYSSSLPSVPSMATAEQDKEQNLEAFAAELPFYIASTNLLWVIAKNEDGALHTKAGTSSTATASHPAEAVLTKGTAMLNQLTKWKEYLGAAMGGGKTNEAGVDIEHGSGLEVEGVNVTDVFALEDALGRVVEISHESFDN